MTAAIIRDALLEPDHVYSAISRELDMDPAQLLARLADEIARPYESPRTEEL